LGIAPRPAADGDKSAATSADARAVDSGVEPEPLSVPSAEARTVPEPPKDAQVKTASGDDVAGGARGAAAVPDSASLYTPALNALPGTPATEVLARVGNTPITYRELRLAVTMRTVDDFDISQLSKEQRHEVFASVLRNMIDRTVLIQEMRRQSKNPKQWELALDQVRKRWNEDELPRLVRKLKFDDVVALKLAFEKKGLSLEEWAQQFELDSLAREYLVYCVRDKIESPTLTDMRDYYREHLKEFDRPATATWREIRVSYGSETERAAALAKATGALRRIQTGEDFGTVARVTSDGATAAAGGLWERTSLPAQTTVAALNQMVDRLGAGQTSGLIEAPGSYHIVRVEEKREAGPASFVEVQKTIAESILDQRRAVVFDSFLQKCRGRAVVWSVLDDSQSAIAAQPALERAAAGAPSAKPDR
jgi:parvulin-like peptidyl-prolyl isomerase